MSALHQYYSKQATVTILTHEEQQAKCLIPFHKPCSLQTSLQKSRQFRTEFASDRELSKMDATCHSKAQLQLFQLQLTDCFWPLTHCVAIFMRTRQCTISVKAPTPDVYRISSKPLVTVSLFAGVSITSRYSLLQGLV